MPKKNITSIFPPALKAGGTIGVVSPARWADPTLIAQGKKFLEKRGYRVVVSPQNYMKDGRLAGGDAARAQALMDMFADPSIDAIFCARGGTGAIRILDKLDYKLIKRNPKPLVGFSDTTLLLQVLSKRCGFVTYHGPMFRNFVGPHRAQIADDLFAVIGKKKGEIKLNFSKTRCLREGYAEGSLVGGNMTLLQCLIGTPYDWETQDSILFIEETEEPLYKVDRTLHHLRLAGKFKNVRAVIVGEMVGVGDDEVPYGRDLKRILTEVLPPHIPLCMNFPCGHGKYITTLPVGARVKLTVRSARAELRFSRG